MATSVYFNNQAASREQMLVEDMVIESIRNHGIDVYYIPRDSQSELDELFGDDPVKSFTKAYKIDMYLESYNQFEGNEEFFSKFGLEVQKGVKVSVARRTFEKFITSVDNSRNVPKEGDLIYLPVQLKLMEIKFVEQEKSFFQLGRPGARGLGAVAGTAGNKIGFMFELSLETFRYNGELIRTGYPDIDNIADIKAFGVDYNMNAGGSGTYLTHEIVYQGTSLANSTAKGYVSNWNLPNRVLKLRNVKGSFTVNTAIKGVTSNASWSLANANTMEDASTPFDDNMRIEQEADGFVDWTETNPFGTANE